MRPPVEQGLRPIINERAFQEAILRSRHWCRRRSWRSVESQRWRKPGDAADTRRSASAAGARIVLRKWRRQLKRCRDLPSKFGHAKPALGEVLLLKLGVAV